MCRAWAKLRWRLRLRGHLHWTAGVCNLRRMLPSDITGFSIYRKETGEMEYQPGAVLCNLFWPMNSTVPPRARRSALLEAMEENRLPWDGVTHAVPRPFVVIATQNPTGASGTQAASGFADGSFYGAPFGLGYPSADAELELLRRKQKGALLKNVQQVMDRRELLALRKEVRTLYISDSVLRYIVELNAATREHADILQGASPRAPRWRWRRWPGLLRFCADAIM